MSRPRLFALMLAAGATVAAAVVVSVTHGLLDAVMMVAVVLALAGLYRLRHFARATLLYRRHPSRLRASRTRETTPADARPSGPDRVRMSGEPSRLSTVVGDR